MMQPPAAGSRQRYKNGTLRCTARKSKLAPMQYVLIVRKNVLFNNHLANTQYLYAVEPFRPVYDHYYDHYYLLLYDVFDRGAF